MADQSNNNKGVESSYLTRPVALIIWLGLCIVCVMFEKTQLALFLGFVLILTSISYFWAKFALKNVDLVRHSDRYGVFPGQTFSVSRTIVNKKALPLIWVEIHESCDLNEPAGPRPEFIISHQINVGDEKNVINVYERLYTISLVHWFGKVTFPDEWTAHNRGIMRLGRADVRSGDGFGLTSVGKTFDFENDDRIVVFPTLYDVSVSSIVNDMWDTRSRTTGYLEDRSVIRSIRDYQAGDPVRNINMRLLARGQSLKSNVFEIVTPDTILFILDSGSFNNTPNPIFEDMLSVTASLIDALSRRGIAVALFTPASAWYAETCTDPSSTESGRYEMFALLAGVSKDDVPINGVPPEWVEETGKIYCVSAGPSRMRSPGLLGFLPEHKVRMLTPDDIDLYKCKGNVV